MKTSLAFLMVMFGLMLQAQQISVKSFRGLSNDLDARTYYPKEDRNGEKAAIIKIVTNETGFEFDAGSIGIVASEQKTGEIWLYIPRGSKALTIKHPKFTLLRNYAYPQAIEAGEVYEMVLITGKVITTVEEPTIETQWLIITTEPAGADVYINDQPAGKSPYQNELPTGKYTWRVSKELYTPEVGIAELTSGSEKQIMNIKMKPNFGTLNISSSPENGASVSLNGIKTGKVTPCIIEMVPTGENSISLNSDLYETTSQHFNMVAGETKQVTVNMNPTFAQISVISEPPVDIYINGQFKANATWQGKLNPGVYTFEARSEKYNTATEQQTVIVGQPLNIKLSPTPKTGNLKIMATPINASVKMEGKEIGKTPLTLKNHLIGDYTIELSMDGYATAFEKVTIAENKTIEVNIKLQSGMQVNINSDPSGSDLFIDDQVAGKTPFAGTISIGKHMLRIDNNGKKVEKEVQISKGATTSYTLAIKSDTIKNGMDYNPEMVFVQGGTFQMGSKDGSSDEGPVHAVTLSDFYIGKYEVTQNQWRDIMGNDPSKFKNCDNCPVEDVTWDDIQKFILKLNHVTGKKYRLPSEAEWEYAAKGGIKSNGYKYSGSNSIDDVAWYYHNSGAKTHPVGQKQANELGLYDMSGNVMEICGDWEMFYPSKSQTNPRYEPPEYEGTNLIHVYRGGSWDCAQRRCTTTFRPPVISFSSKDHTSNDIGFRLVLAP